MTKNMTVWLALIICGIGEVTVAQQFATPSLAITAHFTPDVAGGGIEQYVIAEINKAKKVICCQAYEFTSTGIADALIAARQRGVDVTVVLDGRASKSAACQGSRVQAAGGKVFVDPKHAIAHNKIMLFDAQVVLTGSYNYSNAAEHSNAENILIVRNYPGLHDTYFKQFDTHLLHSLPLPPAPVEAEEVPAPAPAERIRG